MSEVTKYQYGEPVGEHKGRNIFGGNCWNGMPAVFIEVKRQTGGRYPETEEEWELFGPHLPDTVTVITDDVIHCQDYQALVSEGVSILDCNNCPLNQTHTS